MVLPYKYTLMDLYRLFMFLCETHGGTLDQIELLLLLLVAPAQTYSVAIVYNM